MKRVIVFIAVVFILGIFIHAGDFTYCTSCGKSIGNDIYQVFFRISGLFFNSFEHFFDLG